MAKQASTLNDPASDEAINVSSDPAGITKQINIESPNDGSGGEGTRRHAASGGS